MALSPDGMGEAVIRNLKKRTGRSLEQWVTLAKRSRLIDPKELRKWLKEEHGLGATTCWIIADATLGELGVAPKTPAELLDTQFAGEKSAFRPVYDRLVREIKKLGADVSIHVRQTQTTFARRHTFAIAKAPTLTRIDLGLRLPDTKPTTRLQLTEAFSGNATHCIALNAVAQIDAKLGKWLEDAYDARG